MKREVKIKRVAIYALASILLFASAGFAEETLRLATTTSTYESGLLDYILPPFEKKHNIKVHIISVGTGKAIKLGENGDVDIILVHARKAEDEFVNDGYGLNRRDIMYNDFLILGPKGDPAGIDGAKDASDALSKVSQVKACFVSRGDDSGTNKKERYLWEKAKVIPQGEWYLESGQGMSITLRMADEKDAYVIVDRATYLFNKDKISLKKMVEGDKDLFNPYGVIAVSPYKHPHVKYELSMALIAWLTRPACQKMINDFKINGERLFIADFGK
jgi:tungstate transport system substrate-binding protein